MTATKPVVERDGWVIRQQYELPRSPTGKVLKRVLAERANQTTETKQ